MDFANLDLPRLDVGFRRKKLCEFDLDFQDGDVGEEWRVLRTDIVREEDER